MWEIKSSTKMVDNSSQDNNSEETEYLTPPNNHNLKFAASFSLCVQILNHSDDDDDEGDGEDLAARADEGGEDQRVA